MITKLLQKLKGSKARRDLFVAGQIKTGIPFQVRALRDKRGWTQAQLGAELGMTQTNISRLESPGYGRLNITTLQRIASVFGVALVVRFVPFSELIQWTDKLSPEVVAPQSFEEEVEQLERVAAMPTWYQGSFARATYIAPRKTYDIDITAQWSTHPEPITTRHVARFDSWILGGILGELQGEPIQVSSGDVPDEMPVLDYTGESNDLSLQPTGYHVFVPPVFVQGGKYFNN